MGTDAETAAMRHAFQLAARGPLTGANPRVGCVLLGADGTVLGEGFHRGAGTPHAEVDALTTSSPADVVGSTAVVSLEPCAHAGRTGPCVEALLAAGVARVVYSVGDPGAESGGGGDILRTRGVDVEGGVLADEGEEFLDIWLTSMRLGRPFVTLKWASSLDGRVAAPDGSSRWITGGPSRRTVHDQRASADAIAVGTGTVFADDPALTARDDDGSLLPHQPLPVVIGERPVPPSARLRRHPRGIVETGTRDLSIVLAELAGRGIRHLFVEGGPTLATAFTRAGLVDRFSIDLAPALIGGPMLAIGDLGIGAIEDTLRLELERVERIGEDIHVLARPAVRPTRSASAPGPLPRAAANTRAVTDERTP